jgi:Mg/Co/Ni transporter MgtE
MVIDVYDKKLIGMIDIADAIDLIAEHLKRTDTHKWNHHLSE